MCTLLTKIVIYPQTININFKRSITDLPKQKIYLPRTVINLYFTNQGLVKKRLDLFKIMSWFFQKTLDFFSSRKFSAYLPLAR